MSTYSSYCILCTFVYLLNLYYSKHPVRTSITNKKVARTKKKKKKIQTP